MAKYQYDEEEPKRDGIGAIVWVIGAVAVFVCLMMWAIAAHAHVTDENRLWIAQLSEPDKQYLNSQHAPNGVNCCSDADGDETDEDIDFRTQPPTYYVRSAHTNGVWIAVPQEAVLTTPNIHGRPVAWWKQGAPVRSELIRCYAAGAKS